MATVANLSCPAFQSNSSTTTTRPSIRTAAAWPASTYARTYSEEQLFLLLSPFLWWQDCAKADAMTRNRGTTRC